MQYWRFGDDTEWEIFYFPKEGVAFWENEKGNVIAGRFPNIEGIEEIVLKFVDYNLLRIGVGLEDEEAEELLEDLKDPKSWSQPTLGKLDANELRSNLYDYLTFLKSKLNRRQDVLAGYPNKPVQIRELMDLILNNPV